MQGAIFWQGRQPMRRLVAGTGWKMNNGIADSIRYAEALKARIASLDTSAIDIYVLPPFTSLATAAQAFAGSPVAVGGQMTIARLAAWRRAAPVRV